MLYYALLVSYSGVELFPRTLSSTSNHKQDILRRQHRLHKDTTLCTAASCRFLQPLTWLFESNSIYSLEVRRLNIEHKHWPG